MVLKKTRFIGESSASPGLIVLEQDDFVCVGNGATVKLRKSRSREIRTCWRR